MSTTTVEVDRMLRDATQSPWPWQVGDRGVAGLAIPENADREVVFDVGRRKQSECYCRVGMARQYEQQEKPRGFGER